MEKSGLEHNARFLFAVHKLTAALNRQARGQKGVHLRPRAVMDITKGDHVMTATAFEP